MDPIQPTPDAPVASAPEELTPTRLQSFVMKHPRAARVLAIFGVTAAAVGTVHVTRTISHRRQHLVEAGDHAKEVVTELGNAVSPTDPTA